MKDPTFKEAPLFKWGVMGSIFYYWWEVEITAEKDMGGWVGPFTVSCDFPQKILSGSQIQTVQHQ